MKYRILALALSVVWSAALSTPRADAQDMIGVNWAGNVYSIDSVTGSAVLLGNAGMGSGANAMAVGPQGTIYLFQRIGAPGNTQTQIATVDPMTGAGTPINSPLQADVRGAAYDPITGLIFFINDHVSTVSGMDELTSYDLNTQAMTSIGPTGDINLQSLAITPDGTIYSYPMTGAFSNLLVTLDRNTGALTLVSSAPQTSPSSIQFLTAKDNGTIYSGRDDLNTIDTATGVMSLLFSAVAKDLRGCAFLNVGPPCFTTYGTGCPGSGGFTPEISLTDCPIAGAGISINISKGLGGANAVLFFGTMQAALPMGGGCFLNVQPLLPLTVSLPLGGAGPGAGAASVVGVVPLAAAGLTLTTQVFIVDPGGGFAGFTASNGLEMPFQ